MSKRFHTFFLLPVLFAGTVNAQQNQEQIPGDTANTPYWIDMMADPSVNFYQTVRAFELYWEHREVEKGSGYKPFRRWEFGTGMIIDENGNIPAPGTLEGFIEEYLMANPPGYGGSSFPGVPNLGPAECLTNGKWVEIGPVSLASNRTSQPNGLGRLNAIAFHPSDSNTIYVGSPAGGLWVTNDGGKNWHSNTDTLPTLGVSSIVVNYQHPDTVYLGTGDRDAGDSYGRGVIRSFDGGSTWQMANTGMGNVVVGRMALDPNDPSILLAATSNGMYRSTNHGNSWTRVETGNFKEVVYHPVNSNFIYAATYSGAAYYRSTDNGQTWTNITSGLPSGQRRMVIAVTPADTSMVYVLATGISAFQGLYLSTDNGGSFTQMSNSPNIMDYSTTGSGSGGQAWYDLDMAIDPASAGIIYVGGVNIFRSDDSGKTWKINAHWVGSGTIPGIHADQHVLEFSANNHLFVGNDGGIYKTTNGGASYTDLSKGLGIAQIYRLSQSATNSDMLINGFQDNGTGLLDKGSWHTVLGGDGMDCVIDPSDPTWSYSALYYGDVRRYKNGYYSGRIAANSFNGISESGGWVTPFVLRQGNSSTMFIGYKNVWRSTNIQEAGTNNITWTKISSGLAGYNNKNITHLENPIPDPDILYMIRSDNKLFITTNAGDSVPTWTDLTSKLPSTGAVRWLESHARNKNRIWISQADNKVYESNDGGNTWTDISNGLPNIPVTCILFDTSSIRGGMYAGTYMGVFYTDTAMGKWVWFNSGMPVNSRVTDLDIYYDSSGRSKSHIVASTYGRGNWRSPLFDETQKPPVAEFNTDINSGCVDQVVEFTDVSLNTPTRWTWQVSPATVEFVNGTDSFSQHPHIRFLQKGKYSVQLKVENCNGIDSVVKSDLVEIFDGVKPANCSPVTLYTDKNYGIGIFNVSVGKLDYGSTGAFEEGGYIDLGCREVVELQTDTTYEIEITTGRTYGEFVKVYIDFNNNGQFNPVSELVWSGGKAVGLHSGSIYIPDTAENDAILRMRVISDYDSLSSNACDTLRYGQAEDFGVHLISRKPVPHFTIDRRLICKNDQIVLTDSSYGEISAHKWLIFNQLNTDTLFGPGPHTYNAKSTGSYRVQLILNDGLVEKTVDSLFYSKPRPAAVIQLPDDEDTLCAGTNLVINSKDTNSLPEITRQWYQDNKMLSGADESELGYYPATKDQHGAYFMVADKDGCTDTSNVLDVVIHGTPVVDFTITAEEECENYNRFKFSNSTTPPDSVPLKYKWAFGDNNTTGSRDAVKTYGAAGDYMVKLIAESAFGCEDTLAKTVTVKPSPEAGFKIYELEACLTGNRLWVYDTTRYNGNYSFNWDFGDGNTSTDKFPKHSYARDGLYNVRLTALGDNGCKDTFVDEIEIFPQPEAGFGINKNLQCIETNDFSFLNTSTVGRGLITEFEWHSGDGFTLNDRDLSNYKYASTGEYQVKLKVWSDAGCKDSVTRTVKVGANPKADFNLSLDENCFNEHRITVSDKSTISEGTIADWYWHLGDGRIEGGAVPSSFRYDLAGDYDIMLVVHSDLGCTDTTLLPVQINASPELDFEVDIVCEGFTTPFNNLSTINSGFLNKFQWSMGDGTTSSSISPEHRYAKTGVYDVTLIGTSDAGCSDTLTRENAVIIHERPEARFAYTELSSWETNTEVQFNDRSTGRINAWDWDIETFGTEIVQNPIVVFSDTGHFNVRLIVTNEQECKDTATEQIFLIPETNVFIPNTFTPNGDELNDLFGVKGVLYATSFQFEIYNRWGARLFSATDPRDEWNGSFKGETVPAGMYLYKISFTDLKGESFEYEGTVNVLR